MQSARNVNGLDNNGAVFTGNIISPEDLVRYPEMVNHPAHYGGKDDPYEAIKVIEAWNLNFNLGCVLKYICRLNKKPGGDLTQDEKTLEDLKKAAWYLQREIDRFRAEMGKQTMQGSDQSK